MAQQHRSSLCWCHQGGASTKENHGFYTCTVSPCSSLALPPSLWLLPHFMSIHLAGITGLHLLHSPKGWQFPTPAVSLGVHSPGWHHASSFPFQRVGTSWPPVSGSDPELNLHFSLHLNLQPRYLHQVYPQHSSSKGSCYPNPIDFTGR